MPGFPSRIVRASLGPTLLDTAPPRDPRKAIGADTFNLAFWQVAGMNLTARLGVLVLTRTGSVYATTYQGFAFDPEAAMPNVLWTREGAGVYTYSLPLVSYPDEAGNSVAVAFTAGAAHPQVVSAALQQSTHQKTGARAGRVRLFTVDGSGATLTDLADGQSLMVELT